MGEPPKDFGGEDHWHGYDAAGLIALSGDVSILLSEQDRVLDVLLPETGKFDADLKSQWRGRAFQEIVAKDSVGKISLLLNHNSESSPGSDRWRHLNFLVDGPEEIPLLAKNFRFRTPYGSVRQVVCRDLRPMTKLNARWQTENKALLNQINNAPVVDLNNGSASVLVGTAPLSDIMTAAVDEVAKICIEEAIRSCNGDLTAAAKLLGITAAELRQRRRKAIH